MGVREQDPRTTLALVHLGRGQVTVQGSIDVPAVESGGPRRLVLLAHRVLVEGAMVRVLELGLGQAPVVVHDPISNQLDLGHAGDGLQVWVQHGLCLLGRLRRLCVGGWRIEGHALVHVYRKGCYT